MHVGHAQLRGPVCGHLAVCTVKQSEAQTLQTRKSVHMWLMTIETSFYLAFCTSSFWHQQLRRIEICRLQLFFS